MRSNINWMIFEFTRNSLEISSLSISVFIEFLVLRQIILIHMYSHFLNIKNFIQSTNEEFSSGINFEGFSKTY